MKTKQEILGTLVGFTGTEHYYKYMAMCGLYPMKLTDGVKYLCESAECYWIVDLVASYQLDKRIRRDERLSSLQFWKLKKSLDNSAWMVCERDTDDVAIRQYIEHTDFPLEEIKLYYSPIDRVLLLPDEY